MAEGRFAPDVEAIELLLRRTAFLVRQHGRRILDRFDITPPQFDALQILVHNDQLTMGDLCQRLYLASSTVTDLVQRMERAGFVRRERDPVDRRLVRLTVLDKGRRLIEEVIDERRAYLESVLAHMEAEERAVLQSSLEKLLRIMREVGQAGGPKDREPRPADAEGGPPRP
ncbi:MAG: MarR family transcriptional regulator [Clostridia bacterium]|nr:MarR family transcriptional regulator [Clostridia bacterium]